MKISATNNVNFGLRLDTKTFQPIINNWKNSATEKEIKTALTKIEKCADNSYSLWFLKLGQNTQDMILQKNGHCKIDKTISLNKPVKKLAKEIVSFVRDYIKH